MDRRSEIRLAVFDLGGVLVQADRSWVDAARRIGYELADAWLAKFERQLATLPRRGDGSIDSEEYCARFAALSGGVFAATDAARIHHAALGAEYPGIASVFDALERARVETAVLSNTDHAHWERLFPPKGQPTEFPVLARVRHRLASHLLRVEKPDARAYRAVEAATGVSGDAVLFFDDREENVAAARAVGWTAEVIDHRAGTAAQLLATLQRLGIARD